MSEAQWLSATSAGRLLRCPASAAFTGAPLVPDVSAPTNVGSLAHLAMGSWLVSGDWLDDSPGATLQSAWDSEAARWGLDPKRLEDSVLTRSRLRRRGAELASLLSGSGTHALSEVVLRDDARRLYGQLDIVVDDAGGAVADLKTSEDRTDDISTDVRTQLLLYAHLYSQQYGHLPASLVVFSLRHGAVSLEYSAHDVEALLAQVDQARSAVPRLAVPNETGCRYCKRRLRCEPHWEAAAAWSDPDCVEGRIVKVEKSRAGLTAVRLETSHGDQWVTGLTVANCDALSVGQSLRVAQITDRGNGVGRDWRANRFTRTLVVHGPMPTSS